MREFCEKHFTWKRLAILAMLGLAFLPFLVVSLGSIAVITNPPPIVDVRAYGASPDSGSMDSSAGFQAAWAACKNGDTLYIPPGRYNLQKRVNWTADGKVVDISARNTMIVWYGKEPGPIITYGGATQRMLGVKVEGLTIQNAAGWSGNSGKEWDIDNTGIRLQHLSLFDIRLGWINEFRQGIVLGGVVSYSQPSLTFSMKGCKYGLSVDQSDPSWWHNRITFDECRFAGTGRVNPEFPPPMDSGYFIYTPDTLKRGVGGWVFRGCSFESSYAPGTQFDVSGMVYSEFISCWFESNNSVNPAGPHKMPFKTGKPRNGHLAIIGEVQNSLDVQNEGATVIQMFKQPENETLVLGTKPYKVRGNIQVQSKMQVEP